MELKILDHHDHYKFLGEFQNTQHLDDKAIEEPLKNMGHLVIICLMQGQSCENLCAAYTTVLHVENWLADWYLTETFLG